MRPRNVLLIIILILAIIVLALLGYYLYTRKAPTQMDILNAPVLGDDEVQEIIDQAFADVPRAIEDDMIAEFTDDTYADLISGFESISSFQDLDQKLSALEQKMQAFDQKVIEYKTQQGLERVKQAISSNINQFIDTQGTSCPGFSEKQIRDSLQAQEASKGIFQCVFYNAKNKDYCDQQIFNKYAEYSISPHFQRDFLMIAVLSYLSQKDNTNYCSDALVSEGVSKDCDKLYKSMEFFYSTGTDDVQTCKDLQLRSLIESFKALDEQAFCTFMSDVKNGRITSCDESVWQTHEGESLLSDCRAIVNDSIGECDNVCDVRGVDDCNERGACQLFYYMANQIDLTNVQGLDEGIRKQLSGGFEDDIAAVCDGMKSNITSYYEWELDSVLIQ